METFPKGTVVFVPFPFSDLSQAKLRPALVLASAGRGDYLLCQITSNPYGDPKTIALADIDFAKESLAQASFARPTKLFTAHASLLVSRVGQLKHQCVEKIMDTIITWLKE